VSDVSRALAALLLLAVVLSRAWVCDDAYITFRTLDNFMAGHGLRWNVDERVQTYTHPLWLLLHVPLRWLSGEVFYTTLALSGALSLAAFWVGSRLLVRQPAWRVWAAALPLLLSQAFVDYATSGLENPLTFLLLALFGLRVLDDRGASPLALSLLAGAAALNRLDTILLFAPALAVALWRAGRAALRPAALGFAPLALWSLFGLLYYGSVLPNTRYAKLPANASLEWHLRNGSAYVVNLVERDPVSAALLAAGLALAAGSALAWAAGRVEERPPRGAALLGLGVLGYCAYAVAIGGDFMQGRFFAAPVFGAALVLWSALPAPGARAPERWVAAGLAVAVLLGVRALSPGGSSTAPSGIDDERAFYADTNSLAAALAGGGPGRHLFAVQGATARARAEALARSGSRDRYVVAASSVGMLGYFAGPDVIVVDSMALTDPLLARLPVWRPLRMRVGHPQRQVPEGYLEARRTGSLDAMDPDLRLYYAALRRIASDPVFDSGRLATLLRFQLGAFDASREAWESRQRLRDPGSPAPAAAPLRPRRARAARRARRGRAPRSAPAARRAPRPRPRPRAADPRARPGRRPGRRARGARTRRPRSA
jgi:arabinofuranosyltransferase